MKPDEKIVLLLIFLTGMFAGASTHILFFAPHYEATEIEGQARLSIVGEMYGGCSRALNGCPSFRLKDDRSYDYLSEGAREEGKLPSRLADPILTAMTDDYRLKSLAAPVENDSCRSYVDGVDYRYEVVLDGVRYKLDSCKTSLAYNSEMQEELQTVWQFMERPTTTYPTIIEDGIAVWFMKRFRGE